VNKVLITCIYSCSFYSLLHNCRDKLLFLMAYNIQILLYICKVLPLVPLNIEPKPDWSTRDLNLEAFRAVSSSYKVPARHTAVKLKIANSRYILVLHGVIFESLIIRVFVL